MSKKRKKIIRKNDNSMPPIDLRTFIGFIGFALGSHIIENIKNYNPSIDYNRELENAIKNEDYEEAARLRDIINAKNGGSHE